MSDIIITAENLGKKYTIGHQRKNAGYKSLRDELSQNARGLFRKTSELLRGKDLIQGDTQEDFWALKDVSFKIRRGEAVGIIGRNGAGKSTLLKVLSRITEPSAGRVTIMGRVASLLEVGTGFHPELTGRENIYLNGAILGMGREEIKRKFDEIVAFAEVEKFLDTPVKRYSSGMYVRLAFSVAAHLEPEILVVDEVLAVGDAEFQKKCLGKMGVVAKEGRTVLFVSHNMAAIGRLCPRCFLLNKGQITSEGYTKQVIDKYLSDEDSTEGDLKFQPDTRKSVQVLRIRLLDDHDRISLSLDRMRPFRLAIEIVAHEDASNGEIGVSLETIDGVRICDSVSADEMERFILFKAGKTYLAQVEFPGGLLNAGSYRLSVSVVSNHTHLDGQYFPAFRLVNMGEFTSFVGATYNAILLVKTKWQTEQI